MPHLSHFLADTAAFHRNHKTVAAMVWLSSCIVAALATVPLRLADLPVFVVNTAMGAAFAFLMLVRYEKVLKARIAAANGGPVWQVEINGVAVGEIKDADYAAIRRAVLCDSRLYVAQLFNLGGVAMRMADSLFRAILLGVFLLAIGCFFFAPDFFADALAAIQKDTLAQAVAAIPMLALFLIVVSVITLGAHFTIDRHFGFVNQFDQACGLRIRRAVACAADGEVSLSRLEDGIFISPDEPAAIWGNRTFGAE